MARIFRACKIKTIRWLIFYPRAAAPRDTPAAALKKSLRKSFIKQILFRKKSLGAGARTFAHPNFLGLDANYSILMPIKSATKNFYKKLYLYLKGLARGRKENPALVLDFEAIGRSTPLNIISPLPKT